MLDTLVPLAFVSVSVLPCVNAVTMGFTLMPLADVRVIMEAAPDTVPGL